MVTKFSISLCAERMKQLDQLCAVFDCKRSQILSMAIKRLFESYPEMLQHY